MTEDSRKRLEERGIYLPAVLGAGGGWKPREVPGEPWPLPNPLGVVPVVEWLNRPRLGGAPISDITGVMAMQDAINMMWAYLFTAADHASMPARVVLGAEPPKVPILDENGQVIGSRPAKMDDIAGKRLLFLPGATGIEQWDAAKSDFFTRRHHRGRRPHRRADPHAGPLPADEREVRQPQRRRPHRRRGAAGDEVRQLPDAREPGREAGRALMALVRDKKSLADAILAADGRRFVQWKDPAMHSLGQVADAATKDRAVGRAEESRSRLGTVARAALRHDRARDRPRDAGRAHRVGRVAPADQFTAMAARTEPDWQFERLVESIIQETARAAQQAALVGQEKRFGWVRHLTLPSCSRCAVLAGRLYRWSDSFQRHPGCDCTMVPVEENDDSLVEDPAELARAGQVNGLSKADLRAVDLGADIHQVVNVQRQAAGLTEPGRVLARRGRLTPEGIFRTATSRDEALALLARHGYLR
jgi:hypothetical protein